MKETTSTSRNRPESPALKSLMDKMDKTEKAALKAYADFEKKQSAYKDALENEPAKNVFFQIWSAMKIARLTYKIKRTEYKLAKYEYKFAKKAAKRTEKEMATSEVNTPKEKTKKTSGPKKVAA